MSSTKKNLCILQIVLYMYLHKFIFYTLYVISKQHNVNPFSINEWSRISLA